MLLRGPWVAGMLAGTLVLSSCGGGGGGGDTRSTVQAQASSDGLAASSTLANACSVEGQKAYTRSYLNEVYLWYDEIVDVSAAQYQDVESYFQALLVRTPDANGLPKDRYSAVVPASTALWQASQKYGRPAQLTQAESTQLAAGANSVPITKVVNSPGGRKAGYVLFLDHDQGSQDALINSFRQLRDQQIHDLVLDLRYNSGGYLYAAVSAASMVTGPQSQGKVFEQLRYNKKRTNETANSYLLFSTQVQFGESTYPRGTPLPQLNLPRLYVLTSKSTCSASESIINSLRGIDVQVILVGQATCGKPYGFTRQDNCAYAYFPIEFQGFNAKGYGDYTAGFPATCNIASDTKSTMGDPSEPLLSAALTHMDTGSCPAGTASALGVELSLDSPVDPSVPVRPPWAGRLLAPER